MAIQLSRLHPVVARADRDDGYRASRLHVLVVKARLAEHSVSRLHVVVARERIPTLPTARFYAQIIG